MATLTVLKFPAANDAVIALDRFEQLQKQHLITLHDAAWVSWPKGKKRPKTRQLDHATRTGALDGSFWGLFFGLIFFVPVLGMAVGAAMGGVAGRFADMGIDDDFINQIRGEVTEGTSALFLFTSDAVMDRVAAAFSAMDFEIIATNLSVEDEEQLRALFSDE